MLLLRFPSNNISFSALILAEKQSGMYVSKQAYENRVKEM